MTAVSANCIRYAQKALADWGTAQGIPVGFRAIRDPLNVAQDDGTQHDEKVIFRVSAHHRPQSRTGQRRHSFAFEFHCLSKRGDLRLDGQADRANILASLIEEEFLNKDVTVYDAVGGNLSTALGVLHFRRGSSRIGDQRGTIFGDSVDYSTETPKTEHWVVTVTASLNT